MIYAGIGSRNTPKTVQNSFQNIGKYLASQGWELRSGGSNGADQAFEKGCDEVSGAKSIYLPWKYFNGSHSGLYLITDEAMKMAEKYHPNWERLGDGAKSLHARNCYQVLGYDLNSPADLIICYTKGGGIAGGTGQALRIAKDYGIKVFNAGAYDDMDIFNFEVCSYLTDLGMK